MIDLHTHTTESDGTLTPLQLVHEAQQQGITTLAITDHDTISGWLPAAAACDAANIELIPGIELSTKFRGRSVHVLGYFPQLQVDAGFSLWIQKLQESRHARNRELVDRLCAAGFEVTLEELFERGGTLPGRPHIAAMMVERGFTTTVQMAFTRYLAEGASCYVGRLEPTFEDAVARVTSAGGQASLAHPVRLTRDTEVLADYLREMKSAGLGAIEVFHSDHTPHDVQRHTVLAAQFGLAQTGGSDFHGGTKPGVLLAGKCGRVQVPGFVLQRLPRIEVPSRGTTQCSAFKVEEEESVRNIRTVLTWLSPDAPQAGADYRAKIAGCETTVTLCSIDDRMPSPAPVPRCPESLVLAITFALHSVTEIGSFCCVELLGASGQSLAAGIAIHTPDVGPGAARPILWFTGLSGAGKTTICEATLRRFNDLHEPVEWLDGDVVRTNLNRDLGFSRTDREENAWRIAFVANLLSHAGQTVLVSAISPYRSSRELIRCQFDRMIEVYVNAPLSVCETRDVKGLYKRVRAGQVSHFTGVDDPYEPPLTPEVECRTDQETLSESVDKVMATVVAASVC